MDFLTPEIISKTATSGVFAILFVSLFIWVLKQNGIREIKYQETIHDNQNVIQNSQRIIFELTKKFDIINVIKTEVSEIKLEVFKPNNNDSKGG